MCVVERPACKSIYLLRTRCLDKAGQELCYLALERVALGSTTIFFLSAPAATIWPELRVSPAWELRQRWVNTVQLLGEATLQMKEAQAALKPRPRSVQMRVLCFNLTHTDHLQPGPVQQQTNANASTAGITSAL